MPSNFPPGFRTSDGVPLSVPANAVGALTNDGAGNLSFDPAAGGAAWGGITGTLSAQTDLQSALDAKVSFPGFTSLAADYSFTDNSGDWNTAFGWGNHASAGYLTSAAPFVLSTNLVEQRNGTNAQTHRIYNTWSSSGANYERGFSEWDTNVYRIGTEYGGTGAVRAFKIGSKNGAGTFTSWMNFSTSGKVGINTTASTYMLEIAENSSAANIQISRVISAVNYTTRLGVGGAGNALFTASAGFEIYVNGSPTASFKVNTTGYSQVASGYLHVGTTTTSATPLLKQNGATLSLRLGNDTGFTDFYCRELFLSGSTASQASLNIPAGVEPTSPIEGDIWYDGTNFKARNSTTSLSFGADQSLNTTDSPTFATTTINGNVNISDPTTTYWVQLRNGLQGLCIGNGSITGQPLAGMHYKGFGMAQAGQVSWASGASDIDSFVDLLLVRDAAGILAQRNGTSAQAHRWYNTWSSSGANYERFTVDWVTVPGTCVVGTEFGGTGTAKPVRANGLWTFSDTLTIKDFVGGSAKDFFKFLNVSDSLIIKFGLTSANIPYGFIGASSFSAAQYSFVVDTGAGQPFIAARGASYFTKLNFNGNIPTIEMGRSGQTFTLVNRDSYFAITNGTDTTVAKPIKITTGNVVLMETLPTSDPIVANQLWNDSGTLKISAG